MHPIYHLSHIDLDGYSCQLIMRFTPHTLYMYNANYGAEVMERLEEILEAVQKHQDCNATILITDLNLYPEEAKWLDSSVKKLKESGFDLKIILLDHHGSGEKTAQQYPWYFLDTTRSATKITFDYALEHFSLDAPAWMLPYVCAVNAVDLWKQEECENFEYGKVCMRLISETKELNRTMFANEDRDYKLTLLQSAANMMDQPNAPIVLDEAIHAMKKSYFRIDQDNTLDNLCARKIVDLLGAKRAEMTIYYKGYKGFLSYGLGNTSIIGNSFLSRFPDYDFIVDISARGTMSFRADNHVNVAIIAAEWSDGGGHPNAAGGRIQGFKEQFRYDKVKQQIQSIINAKESIAKTLPWKS